MVDFYSSHGILNDQKLQYEMARSFEMLRKRVAAQEGSWTSSSRHPLRESLRINWLWGKAEAHTTSSYWRSLANDSGRSIVPLSKIQAIGRRQRNPLTKLTVQPAALQRIPSLQTLVQIQNEEPERPKALNWHCFLLGTTISKETNWENTVYNISSHKIVYK